MITDDEVMRLFERADPARVDDVDSVLDAARYLDAFAATSTDPTPLDEVTNRRRRWRVLAAAAAAAALIVATIILVRTASDDGGTVLTPAGPAPSAPAPTPLGAPLVQGPDPGSTLLTSWGRSYTGWVVVYVDGRVIFSNGGSGAKERRLSRRGLDLVRAGKLDLEQFLVTREVRRGEVVISFAEGVSGVYQRRRLWAEPTARIYEPSNYAICPAVPPEVMDQLRASQQNLLRGTEHTYHGTPILDNDPHPPGPPESPRECLEVTRAQIRTLVGIFNDFQVDTGSIDVDPSGDPIQITFKSALPSGTGTDLFVGFFRPLLPHGDWVSFGG